MYQWLSPSDAAFGVQLASELVIRAGVLASPRRCDEPERLPRPYYAAPRRPKLNRQNMRNMIDRRELRAVRIGKRRGPGSAVELDGLLPVARSRTFLLV